MGGCKEGDSVYYTIHAAINWSGRRTTAGHYTACIRECEDFKEMDNTAIKVKNLKENSDDHSFQKGVKMVVYIRKDCSAPKELAMSLLKITPEAQNDMEFILKDGGCMCCNTALIVVDSSDLRNAMKGGTERGALQAILKRDDLTKFKAVIVPIHLRGNEVDHFGVMAIFSDISLMVYADSALVISGINKKKLPSMDRIPFLVPLKCNQPLKYNQSPGQQPGAISRVVGAICLFLLEVYPQPVTELTYNGRRRTINRWHLILVAYNRIRWSLPGATETADEPLLEPRKRPRIVSLAPPMELKEPEDCSGPAKIRRRGVQRPCCQLPCHPLPLLLLPLQLPSMIRIPFLVPLKCNQLLKCNQSPGRPPGAIKARLELQKFSKSTVAVFAKFQLTTLTTAIIMAKAGTVLCVREHQLKKSGFVKQ
eukprot:gene6666-7418_t